ncbi:MAG: sugar kinase [Lachnospiraceae bacterium]
MEHYNPLLQDNDTTQKFITIGEIMLRLTPPNYEKIRMATSFEASYGGSEANIALALANLNVDSTFFSVVPNNSIGKSAIRMLRSNDVHCTPVILSTPEQTPTHRLGTYYLETGYGIRPSKVTYDRKHSAFAEYDFDNVDLDALLEGYTWLHLSGITPAVSPKCKELILNSLKMAKAKGITTSFYGNFRSKMWTWKRPEISVRNVFHMWMYFLVLNHIISGKMKMITVRVTGRTAFRCSQAMSSRMKCSRDLWIVIRILNALPAMYVMHTAVVRTV